MTACLKETESHEATTEIGLLRILCKSRRDVQRSSKIQKGEERRKHFGCLELSWHLRKSLFSFQAEEKSL